MSTSSMLVDSGHTHLRQSGRLCERNSHGFPRESGRLILRRMLSLFFGACTQVQAIGVRHQGGDRVAQPPGTCPEVSGCLELAPSSCVTWRDTHTVQPSEPPPHTTHTPTNPPHPTHTPPHPTPLHTHTTGARRFKGRKQQQCWCGTVTNALHHRAQRSKTKLAVEEPGARGVQRHTCPEGKNSSSGDWECSSGGGQDPEEEPPPRTRRSSRFLRLWEQV